MAIVDQLTASTQSFMIPGAQNQIVTSSQLVSALLRFARFKGGAAGDGIRINGIVDRNTGVWYSGMDSATRAAREKIRSWFALWYNRADHAVLAGTDLEANVGVDSDYLLDNSRDLGTEPRSMAETILNLAGTEVGGAVDSGSVALDYAVWNGAAAQDDEGRVPEDLGKLFDETGAWHGLGVTGLGLFSDHPKDPWTSTAPGQASLNIHVPRIFDNSGTNRTVTKKICQDANRLMAARCPGLYLCGADEDLFSTLDQEFDGNIQIPMGIGTMNFTVDAIRIGSAIYFPDVYAPTDRLRHVHVGAPGANNGSFFPMFWTGAPQNSRFNTLQRERRNMVPSLPSDVMPLGRDTLIPFYAERWQRDITRADSISSALKYKMSFVCTHRWKQYEIRDLAAA